jgi:hypothetical protein
MILDWLFKLGSLAGLLTFCLTIWDRMLSGRPLVWISPDDYGLHVHCKNIASSDITIRKIKCRPPIFGVASSESLNAIASASAGDAFMASLKSDQERKFPLVCRRSELLEIGRKEVMPFAMIVSWRRNGSYWLPQFPKVILSSAKTMRVLKSVAP